MMPVYNTELNGNPETLVCVHWRTFPPWQESKHPGKTATQLYQEGKLDGPEYQRAQVWERICSKFTMDDGCKDCDMARKMGVHEHQPAMFSLDGDPTIVPTTDVPTIDALPKNRSYLLQGRHTRLTRPGARKS